MNKGELQDRLASMGKHTIWQNDCLLIPVSGWDEHDAMISMVKGWGEEYSQYITETNALLSNGSRFACIHFSDSVQHYPLLKPV